MGTNRSITARHGTSRGDRLPAGPEEPPDVLGRPPGTMCPHMEIEDTLEYLSGTWDLTRIFADHRAGTTGSFAGTAEVRTHDRRGRYEERGRLRFGGCDTSAHRALQLVGVDGGAVAVRFIDGRPFFDLDLVRGTCRAVHPCRADRYELAFEVGSPDLLVERWRVTGPEKDYEAETTWRRQKHEE